MRSKYFSKQKRQEKNTLDVVKEHQDPLAINTEESHDAQIPVAAQNVGESQDLGDGGIDQAEEADDVYKLKPIAERRLIGEDIADIKWAFNDTFIIVVTVTNQVFVLDSLCHTFNLILPNACDTAARKKTLRVKNGKSIAAPVNPD